MQENVYKKLSVGESFFIGADEKNSLKKNPISGNMNFMIKQISIFCVVALLTACSQVEPFVDSWTAIGRVEKEPRSSADKVVICYNKYTDDEKQLQKLADAECAKTNRHAEFLDTERFTCCLAAPSTIYYKCVK